MEVKKKTGRGPGRPSTPISREKLLTVARDVFADKGYVGASLSVIAASAGLRKASLYHHFPSKSSLYIAVLDELVHDVRDLFIESHIENGTFRQRLERVAGNALEYMEGNLEGARILARDMIDNGPFMQHHGRHTLSLTLELGASFLKRGMDAGDFRQQDPRQLILSLFGMCLYTYAAANSMDQLLDGTLAVDRRERLMAPIRAICIGEGWNDVSFKLGQTTNSVSEPQQVA